MKRLLLFTVLFMLFSGNLFSQSFGTSDSKWIYDYSGGHSSGITKVDYKKDTIIGTRLVKVFTKYAFRYSARLDSFSFQLNPIYIYSNDGIVEFSIDKINFDTLYNFRAAIDQSWMLYRYERQNLDSMKALLLDTFRTLISNKEIFTQKIEWTSYRNFSSPNKFIDTIYENIGGRMTYIYPFDFEDVAVDGGEGGMLRCFQNNELGVVSFYSEYQSPYEYDCDDLTSINHPENDASLYAIYPNPINRDLNIDSKVQENSTLKILDITGQLILISELHFGSNVVDVSTLSSGYYMVVVDGSVVGKVVK